MSSQAALFCLLLACAGASGPCKRCSLSASARSSFSRRKCSSRDSGDRHIPAQRWCCRAIARYWSALTMVSSHAQGPFARPKPDEPRGTLKGVPIKVRIGYSNALRDVRLLSICTFAEIMSRENLQQAPPPLLMGRIATGIDLIHRDQIIARAARHRLPTVYPYRFLQTGGFVFDE